MKQKNRATKNKDAPQPAKLRFRLGTPGWFFVVKQSLSTAKKINVAAVYLAGNRWSQREREACGSNVVIVRGNSLQRSTSSHWSWSRSLSSAVPERSPSVLCTTRRTCYQTDNGRSTKYSKYWSSTFLKSSRSKYKSSYEYCTPVRLYVLHRQYHK
jgi:hypothetical protein